VILDAYVLRLILESTAARMATKNLTPEGLSEFEHLIEETRQLVRLQDMSQHRQLNKRFHLLIATMSGNSLMNKLYEMISNLFPDWRLYEYMFRHPEMLESSLEREYLEHKAIVDAFQAGEPERAARQVIQHIRNLRVELETFLEIPPEMIAEKEEQIREMLPEE
jgi:DNA-binding GntR family transcriptional regulator